MEKPQLESLSIFYDGNCPLCLAEIHVLKNNNQQQLLQFIDIHDAEAVDLVVDCDLALEVIHAQLASGKVIKGPSVFEEAYKRSDLTVIKWLFSFRLFQQFHAVFYPFFAKFRHQISKLIGPTMLKIAKRKFPEN
jgi:predicted DCC family thiol-disulfide oxidoreductase YuxK